MLVVGILQYYIDIPLLQNLASDLRTWALIMTAVASGVGVINIGIRYGRRISERREYWYLYVWTLLVMAIVAVVGLIPPFATHTIFEWIITNVYMPADASIYAMVFLDIVHAFYRSFRARNIDATILLMAAFFIMIYNAPATSFYLPSVAPIGKWLLDNVGTASNRGIGIVTAIGTLAFTYRVMVHKETSVVGVVKTEAE
jgi:uncharacterized membrane protein